MKNKLLRRRPSPAMVVACLALTVALSGASYAAVVLPRNSVGTPQLKKGAVTTSKLRKDAVISTKVKNRSLKAVDFALGQLPAGPQGIQGIQGIQGPPGLNLWAVVASDGSLIRGSGATSSARLSLGVYTVTFNQNVSNCAFAGTPRNGTGVRVLIPGDPQAATPNVVNVDVSENTADAFADATFYLIAAC